MQRIDIKPEDVLRFIEAHDRPTHRQLQNHYSCGSSVIAARVKQLRTEGKLRPSDGRPGLVSVNRKTREGLMAQIAYLQQTLEARKLYIKELLKMIDELAGKEG